MTDRRSFIGMAGLAAGSALLNNLASAPATAATAKDPWFRISLAEWSFNRSLFANKMTNLDFPVVARRDFGIDSVEYVNQFWMDKAEDKAYLADLKKRCDDNGVKSGLIMCDREGALGDADAAARTKAVENHYKWVNAAAYLGCHSIRVNAQSSGSWGQQLDCAVDGLRRLAEFAAKNGGLNVIVENHGGTSSHGKWLALVIEQVGLPNMGTLPDFGNFNIAQGKAYDRYLGVSELMPFAEGCFGQELCLRQGRQRNHHRLQAHHDGGARRRLPRLRGHRVRGPRHGRSRRRQRHEEAARARAHGDRAGEMTGAARATGFRSSCP